MPIARIMTDYEKLTVVKLREELVKRGLPKSGLKAVLVQRLAEADAQSGQAAPLEILVQQKTNLPIVNGEPNVAIHTAPPETKAHEQYDGPADDAAAHPASALGETQSQDQEAINNKQAIDNEFLDDVMKPFPVAIAPAEKPAEPLSTDRAPHDQGTLNTSAATVSELKVAKDDAIAIAAEQDTAEATEEGTPVIVERPKAMEKGPQDMPSYFTQTSLIGVQDLRVDSNKRKRRSQSPTPSSIETAQKRAKADNGRALVMLPEDETNGSNSGRHVEDVSMGDAPVQPLSEELGDATQANGSVQADDGVGIDPVDAELAKKESMPPESEKPMEEKPPKEDEELTPPPSTTIQSPIKISPTDTRFKNLFNAPSKREGSPPRQIPQVDNEDRVISPAVHPATSALYIRDFMRPLNPGNLREFLTALASPPDTDPDPDIVTEFFLDSIRTHCFVCFTNTSSASRVRSGLHDRVWPDEKNRKPLWVDFVPEEKLKKWINVESEAAGDRRQGTKKWEVIYEEEKEGIVAYLQEVGPNSQAPRSAQVAVSRADGGAGVHGAPSGPRDKDADVRTSLSGPAAKPDGGKAFGALDDLFLSTTTKPKLYYLPVACEVVDKRIERLAAGRGGGRGDEMRRYSFEDGILVDKGPEFGMRGRGGFGARGGGYRGGYPARGGSYRGDAWRGR